MNLVAFQKGAIMEVEKILREMLSLLEVLECERDMKWAQSVCSASRMMHIEVWSISPSIEEVEKRVIPVLEQAKRSLRHLAHDPQAYDGEVIYSYAENVGARIENLMNYVRGRPSDFAPMDRLSEPGSSIA